MGGLRDLRQAGELGRRADESPDQRTAYLPGGIRQGRFLARQNDERAPRTVRVSGAVVRHLTGEGHRRPDCSGRRFLTYREKIPIFAI